MWVFSLAFVLVVMQLQFHLKGIMRNNKGERRVWERKGPVSERWADAGRMKSPRRRCVLYEAVKQKAAAFIPSSQ